MTQRYDVNLKTSLVTPKSRSASYSAKGAESGTSFNNLGATGTVTITLPEAKPNSNFWYLVLAAQTLNATPQATDIIRGKTAGTAYSSATIGKLLWLVCHVKGTWEIAVNTGFV